jgi:N6-L-threonylcarbamoyladenine synthase
MRILGIESSCDETAIALVTGEGDSLVVEKSVVLSQIKEHAKYGGVVPEVAARKHLEAIFPMLQNELSPDGEGIDAIAVTQGPGLAPALRTGVEVAKTLAWAWKKPLLPLSHLEGHIYAAWLGEEEAKPEFPALCLLVSGGHTELILMKGHGDFERLGETLDDAVGEAYDKVAKMLGLGYPGGPALEKLAVDGNPEAFNFPRGLLNRPNVDFSFSGIKTSVLYMLRKNDDKLEDESFRADIAASFHEAVLDILIRKTRRAIESAKPKSLIVAGGVSASKTLRARLQSLADETDVPFFVPPFAYSMDNAAMIAAAGYFRAQNKDNEKNPVEVEADSNLDMVN